MLRIATALLIVGGLNWGLVGMFNFDLVAAIFGGPASLMSRLIYCLVGASAVVELFFFARLKAIDARTDRIVTSDDHVHPIDRAA
jgi:uncharacterized membrane protein YuzA (DUF378 family)